MEEPIQGIHVPGNVGHGLPSPASINISTGQDKKEDENSSPKPLDEEIYIVREIIDCRRVRGELEYLVDWEGYTEDDRTWETEENLQGCSELVEKFRRFHPNKPQRTRKFGTEPDISQAIGMPEDAELFTGKTYCKCPKRTRFRSLLPDIFRVNYKEEEKIVNLVNKLKEANAFAIGQLCYKHVKRLAGAIGLKTRGLGYKRFYLILGLMFDKTGTMTVKRLRYLKTNDQTVEYFQGGRRPWHRDDGVVSWRYPAASYIEKDITPDFEAFGRRIRAIHRNIERDWAEDGTIRVDSWLGFSWIVDNPELAKGMFEETRMYQYHMRHKFGRSSQGWNRFQYYSVIQQIIRADPMMYALFVWLRPDNNMKLISYPYYVRFSDLNDSPEFYHSDLSYKELEENGRNGNLIQGAIHLTDEDENNCFRLVKGFHRRWQEWWQELSDKNIPMPASCVTSICSERYTAEMAEKYGKMEDYPCTAGTLRITRPEIIHGASGSRGLLTRGTGVKTVEITRPRFNVLPWLVGLNDDMETIEDTGCHTWSALHALYNSHASATITPSGLPNRYSKKLYFPAQVNVIVPTALGQVVTTMRRWEDPEALREASILLGSDDDACWSLVKRHREQLAAWAIGRWAAVREHEKKIFGENSYFFKLENGLSVEPDIFVFGKGFDEVLEDNDLAEGRAKIDSEDIEMADLTELLNSSDFQLEQNDTIKDKVASCLPSIEQHGEEGQADLSEDSSNNGTMDTPASTPKKLCSSTTTEAEIIDLIQIGDQELYLVSYPDKPNLRISVKPKNILDWISPEVLELWKSS